MSWISLVIEPLEASRVEFVSSALFDAGAQGVNEEPADGHETPPRQPWDTGPLPAPPAFNRLIAWFEDPSLDEVLAHVTPLVGSAGLRWSTEGADTDWEALWRAQFRPLRAGGIVIAPPWAAEADAIVLEPGIGFGTGNHPTTAAALTLLVATLEADTTLESVLDIGTGSGILALAAAKLGRRAHGIDIEAEAIAQARRTADANALTLTLDTTPLDEIAGPFDLVVANLHAELIVRFADQISRLTRHHLVLAGILADREAIVLDALTPWGEPSERVVEGEWVALAYRR